MRKQVESNTKIDTQDAETQEALEGYCDVVVSIVKRLTREGFDFSKLEKEKESVNPD